MKICITKDEKEWFEEFVDKLTYRIIIEILKNKEKSLSDLTIYTYAQFPSTDIVKEILNKLNIEVGDE